MRTPVPLPFPVPADDDERITVADIMAWARVERALSSRRDACRPQGARHGALR
ncbi:hypothetical protein [Sphingobium lactosutens]|uniref:hypothetical protein n=1 Tax=Sphingobium lactosutens TaxID=522773 RepID=UPI0015BC775D|nr:hypothetical protein [Sphingobium lactosutens]